MKTLRAILAFVVPLGLACRAQRDLLGPPPGPGSYLTAQIDGNGFIAQLPSPQCLGVQITATMFFIDVTAPGTWPTPNLSIHLGGITGPGRFSMKPNEPQESQRAAVFVPGDPARLQYSALTGSGEIQLDEYDPIQRTIAGRFYFDAVRAVGTSGPAWIHVREGSFRGTLAAWGSRICN